MMDIHAILKQLPHRYPFLLVDKVTELERNTRIKAIKNVTFNEPYFMGHFPGRPVMPGVLILEALAQAQDRHRTTLVKQFARRYGLPPLAWLRNWRVARARVLLREGLPLAEAAQAVGFADQAHLTRVFKLVYGSTPGVLRKAGSGEGQTLRSRGVSSR